MVKNSETAVPTKIEIMEFCDQVIAKWSQDGINRPKNILAMTGMKTSVIWTDEATLKAVWGEITEWMRQRLYEDVKAQEDAAAPSTAKPKRTRSTRAKSR